MSGFSKVVGMGGIDLTKWTTYEIQQLRKICDSVLADREEKDKNAARNALGATDRGENGLYGELR